MVPNKKNMYVMLGTLLQNAFGHHAFVLEKSRKPAE